jgi:hypothetical protein
VNEGDLEEKQSFLFTAQTMENIENWAFLSDISCLFRCVYRVDQKEASSLF